MINALSIDLEEWFHAELVRGHLLRERPQRRVAWAVEPLLQLLDRQDVRATFFVVGDVLEHEPDLISRLYAQGHEIACHGWSHRTLWGLDPERLAWELQQFDECASELVPVEEIIGFRAPTFSLDQSTAWALDLLRERGYRYDSSLFPARVGLYGVRGAPLGIYRPSGDDLLREDRGGDLIELPMTVWAVGGFRLPWAGGIYLRALPEAVLLWGLRQVNDSGLPFVLYLHPWEADLGTPRVKGLGLVARAASTWARGSVLPKLEAILETFRVEPLRSVLGCEPTRRAMSATAV